LASEHRREEGVEEKDMARDTIFRMIGDVKAWMWTAKIVLGRAILVDFNPAI
jgi:hypothetical protein